MGVFIRTNTNQTGINFITMQVKRARASFSKNHTLLICRIWKMDRNLFSSLDIRHSLKVAYLEKKSNNPNIYLVTGSCFMKFSSLSKCITVRGTGCVIKLSWNLWVCLSRNQITVVAFQPVQLAQASFLQKSNVAKWVFDICNTEMAQIFHVKKLNSKCELDVRVITCNF